MIHVSDVMHATWTVKLEASELGGQRLAMILTSRCEAKVSVLVQRCAALCSDVDR